MSAALDTLRALARTNFERPPENERNEFNEQSAVKAPIDSLYSFISCIPSADTNELEERAPRVKFGSDVARDWAEGFARLSPEQPPGDVPPARWEVFIDDVGRFLASGFADQAAALGWTSFDLFGCDRDRPFARLDQAGLLWLLNGNRIAMFAEDAAAVETRTGACQTYWRRPSGPGRVLVWELIL